MARTTEMRLMEIVVLQDDVSCVIELLGNKGNFEFQLAGNEGAGVTPLKELYDKLQSVRAYLGSAHIGLVPDRLLFQSSFHLGLIHDNSSLCLKMMYFIVCHGTGFVNINPRQRDEKPLSRKIAQNSPRQNARLFAGEIVCFAEFGFCRPMPFPKT